LGRTKDPATAELPKVALGSQLSPEALMRLSLLSLTVVLVASTACGERPSPAEPVVAAPPTTLAAAQGPPSEVDVSFTVEGFCAFAILFEVRGKAKTIELPGGRTISTGPGLTLTMTNLDNENQETLGITGAFHQDTLANGDLVTVATGRNLLFDPFAGIVLTMGRFTFVFDAEGNLIQPLQGTGRQIDVCELLG
jgi:hypothetical protein